MSKIIKHIDTPSFQLFQKEHLQFSQDWQRYEPLSLDYKDRLDFDRIDFKDFYFNPDIIQEQEFNEEKFLNALIDIYAKAKHDYWKGYVKHLRTQSKKTQGTNLTLEIIIEFKQSPEAIQRIQELIDISPRYSAIVFFYLKQNNLISDAYSYNDLFELCNAEGTLSSFKKTFVKLKNGDFNLDADKKIYFQKLHDLNLNLN